MIWMQLRRHLANDCEINVSTSCVRHVPPAVGAIWRMRWKIMAADLRKPHSCIWTPGTIATKMLDAMSGTDIRPCGKFQPKPFSSLGGVRGDVSQTDRQADRITNSKLYIPYTMGRSWRWWWRWWLLIRTVRCKFLHKTLVARNGLLCADVPLRNYSINQSVRCKMGG